MNRKQMLNQITVKQYHSSSSSLICLMFANWWKSPWIIPLMTIIGKQKVCFFNNKNLDKSYTLSTKNTNLKSAHKKSILFQQKQTLNQNCFFSSIALLIYVFSVLNNTQTKKEYFFLMDMKTNTFFEFKSFSF